jgi:hypothetical protein
MARVNIKLWIVVGQLLQPAEAYHQWDEQQQRSYTGLTEFIDGSS